MQPPIPSVFQHGSEMTKELAKGLYRAVLSPLAVEPLQASSSQVSSSPRNTEAPEASLSWGEQV